MPSTLWLGVVREVNFNHKYVYMEELGFLFSVNKRFYLQIIAFMYYILHSTPTFWDLGLQDMAWRHVRLN